MDTGAIHIVTRTWRRASRNTGYEARSFQKGRKEQDSAVMWRLTRWSEEKVLASNCACLLVPVPGRETEKPDAQETLIEGCQVSPVLPTVAFNSKSRTYHYLSVCRVDTSTYF